MAKHATDRERAEIHALARVGKTQKEIASIIGFKQTRISYLLKQPVTPRKRRNRPVLFNTPQQKPLIDFIKANPTKQWLSISALALQFGAGITGLAINLALALENMGRRYDSH